jgi:hypothetical protein
MDGILNICLFCKSMLEADEPEFLPLECMKDGSGIGIYFHHWCRSCRERFMDSGVDIEINRIILRWVESSRPN